MSETEDTALDLGDGIDRNVIAHDLRVMQYIVTAVAAITTAFATINGAIGLGSIVYRNHFESFNSTDSEESFNQIDVILPTIFHGVYYVIFPLVALLTVSIHFALMRQPMTLASLPFSPVVFALPFLFPLATYLFQSGLRTISLFCTVGQDIHQAKLWFDCFFEMACFFAILLGQLMYLTFLQVLSNQVQLGDELIVFYRRNGIGPNNRRRGRRTLTV